MQRTRLTNEERIALVDAIYNTNTVKAIAGSINRNKRLRKKFRRPITPGNVRGALNHLSEFRNEVNGDGDVNGLMADARDNMKKLQDNLSKLVAKL